MMDHLLPALESYTGQLLAQKLNNRAAHCIEVGEYQNAIGSLVRALQLSEENGGFCMDAEELPCSCQSCSLDYCMTYSQRVSRQSERATSDTAERDNNSSSSNNKENDVRGGGYVYQQPIRVSPQTMNEGHFMGGVLPLLLTFNLALAHHLEAVATQSIGRSKLQRVLKLYELAYRWQIEEESVQADSLRFSMAIANNLGEIHRAVSNHDKHQKCLEHLLSTLMFMVDCHYEMGNSMDMDGFLRNTSELILHGHCAGAA